MRSPVPRSLPALRRAYRATGADGPWGRLVPAHPGVRMEGWFWRLTDRDAGTVVLALLGISRDRSGRAWGTVALAAWPGTDTADGDSGPARPLVRETVADEAWGSADRLALRARADGRDVLRATDDALEVDLGPGARLSARLRDVATWPRRAAWGGVGIAHAVPGLSQYWHPHVLASGVVGEATLGGRTLDLAASTAYAEKNWGGGGFPPAWWWGQAHGFAEPGTLVCLAGGRAGVGPLRATAGAVVVRLPDGRVLRAVRPPGALTVAHDDAGMRLRARTGAWRIEVETTVPAGRAPARLPVPVPAERRTVPTARQHLAARTRLVVRRRGRVVLRDESALAGFERGTA